MKRKYYVMIGSYGSGKTELSLNLAIQNAMEKKRTALVDLDIVNPYFRSAFHGKLLEKNGVKLIASQYTLEASDVPVVTPEVLSAFDGSFDTVVFDVGGDPVGATALGQYHHRFQMLYSEELEILFIVNTRRPLTQTAEEICEMLEKIQMTSRLKVTGLVNNTNLAAESDLGLLDEGQEILGQVSEYLKIPIRYYGVQKKLYREVDKNETKQYQGRPILLDLYTRLEWLDFVPCQA